MSRLGSKHILEIGDDRYMTLHLEAERAGDRLWLEVNFGGGGSDGAAILLEARDVEALRDALNGWLSEVLAARAAQGGDDA